MLACTSSNYWLAALRNLAGKIMKAVMVFRGLHTERIIVKGYGESTQHDNGQVDMWGESKVWSISSIN